MSLRLGIRRLRKLCDLNAVRSGYYSQQRFESVVGGPPKNPLKTWELFVYGGGMAIGVLYLPIYTMFHIRDYAGAKED